MGGSLTDDEIKFIITRTPFKIVSAIETGTYKGVSSRLLSKYFSTVHTIEVHKPLHEEAKSNNGNIDNITYHLGDSTVILPKILLNMDGPALYFIDAHGSGNDSGWNNKELVPLISETKIILDRLDVKTHGVFIFDDVRLFNKYDDWKGVTTNTIKDCFINRNIILEFVMGDRYYVVI